MSKPKEAGKLVRELTPDELLREETRCRAMLGVFRPGSPASKGLKKRLHEIQRRKTVEARDRETGD